LFLVKSGWGEIGARQRVQRCDENKRTEDRGVPVAQAHDVYKKAPQEEDPITFKDHGREK